MTSSRKRSRATTPSGLSDTSAIMLFRAAISHLTNVDSANHNSHHFAKTITGVDSLQQTPLLSTIFRELTGRAACKDDTFATAFCSDKGSVPLPPGKPGRNGEQLHRHTTTVGGVTQRFMHLFRVRCVRRSARS